MQLWDNEFYGRPVVLENEPGLDYLGARLVIYEKQAQTEFVVHGFSQPYQYSKLGDDCIASDRWKYR